MANSKSISTQKKRVFATYLVLHKLKFHLLYLMISKS